MLRNSKGLTRSFFLETWSMLILYKRVTLYTINFCSVCTQVWIASLLSLYNFIQRLQSWYATSRNSPRHTDQRHTFYTSTVCSWFSYLENTFDNVLVSLSMASVANVSPLVYSDGPQMNLASLEKHRWPWYSSRVPVQWDLALGLRGIFVSFSHHTTCAINRHWEWSCPAYGKTISLPISMSSGQFHNYLSSCQIYPQSPYVHCSLHLHGVW
jgi:hypothetical protein